MHNRRTSRAISEAKKNRDQFTAENAAAIDGVLYWNNPGEAGDESVVCKWEDRSRLVQAISLSRKASRFHITPLGDWVARPQNVPTCEFAVVEFSN